MIFGASCPVKTKPSAPPSPPSPVPSAKWTRYKDPKMQEAYARIYGALRTKDVALYGKIFSENEADLMARQAVDAVSALVSSKELRQQVECLIEPIAAAGARMAVGRLLLGTFAAGLAGISGWLAYKKL